MMLLLNLDMFSQGNQLCLVPILFFDEEINLRLLKLFGFLLV